MTSHFPEVTGEAMPLTRSPWWIQHTCTAAARDSFFRLRTLHTSHIHLSRGGYACIPDRRSSLCKNWVDPRRRTQAKGRTGINREMMFNLLSDKASIRRWPLKLTWPIQPVLLLCSNFYIKKKTQFLSCSNESWLVGRETYVRRDRMRAARHPTWASLQLLPSKS